MCKGKKRKTITTQQSVKQLTTNPTISKKSPSEDIRKSDQEHQRSKESDLKSDRTQSASTIIQRKSFHERYEAVAPVVENAKRPMTGKKITNKDPEYVTLRGIGDGHTWDEYTVQKTAATQTKEDKEKQPNSNDAASGNKSKKDDLKTARRSTHPPPQNTSPKQPPDPV